MAPSTRTTVGSATPPALATRSAPSSRASQMRVCQVLATMASDNAEASSSGTSGTPAPPLIGGLRPLGPSLGGHRPLGPSQGPAEVARQLHGLVGQFRILV